MQEEVFTITSTRILFISPYSLLTGKIRRSILDKNISEIPLVTKDFHYFYKKAGLSMPHIEQLMEAEVSG